MYQVYNRITKITKEFKTRLSARRYADKIDNDYGAYICTVKSK